MKKEKVPAGYLCILLFLVIVPIVWVITYNTNDSIIQFIRQNVVIANGIDFKTGKLVSLDPLNGMEIFPCESNMPVFTSGTFTGIKQSQHAYNNEKAYANNNCSVQIVTGESLTKDILLQNAIKSTESIIDGTVRVNGENKDARFIVTVTALYRGSHCTTTYSAGTQRTKCIKKEQECAAIREALGNPNYPC